MADFQDGALIMLYYGRHGTQPAVVVGHTNRGGLRIVRLLGSFGGSGMRVGAESTIKPTDDRIAGPLPTNDPRYREARQTIAQHFPHLSGAGGSSSGLWGIWDVGRREWLPDPLKGHVDRSPATFSSKAEAERKADREWRALNPDETFEVRPFAQESRRVRAQERNMPQARASHRSSNDVEDFKRILDEGVILVAGDANQTIEPHAEQVHVAIVFNVTGYGPHTAAIYVDQNRFHASQDSALQEAHEILEEWEREHYPMSEEDEEHRTETYDARMWTLPASKFCDAIYGTEAERFVEVEGDYDGEDDDDDLEDEDE